MATRTVTGILYGQDGSPQLGKRITATLVDLYQNPVDGWDISTATEKRIVPIKQTVVTDTTDGSFSFDLVPNDHITPTTQYLVQVNLPNVKPLVATLVAGDLSDIDWYDFYTTGRPLTAAEFSAFKEHADDTDIHFSDVVSDGFAYLRQDKAWTRFDPSGKENVGKAAELLGYHTATHAPSNAQKNVQADWNQTTTTSDDYIKNKPTIPSISGLLDETAHDALNHTGLTGILALGTTSGTAMAGDTVIPAAYSHPTTDGNRHVPANPGDAIKVLTAPATAGAAPTWELPTGSGSDIEILDETTSLTTTVKSIKFTGDGVSAAVATDAVTVTINVPTSISGNAATATKLSTSRNINGVAFDGSADITIPSNITPGTSGNVLTSNGTVWTSATPTVYETSGAVETHAGLSTGDVRHLTNAQITALHGVNDINSSAVPTTRTINGLALDQDITIAASTGGLASSYIFCEHVIFAGTTPVWHELEKQSDGGVAGVHTFTTTAYVEGDRYVTDAINSSVIPAGLWAFTLFGHTSLASSAGQLRAQIYRVNTSGAIVGGVLGTAETLPFTNTSSSGIPCSVYIAEQTGWTLTDRIGVVISGKRNGSAATITFSHNLSTGLVSVMQSPILLLHNQLNGLNQDGYQHLPALGSALQQPRVNAVGTALEWFTNIVFDVSYLPGQFTLIGAATEPLLSVCPSVVNRPGVCLQFADSSNQKAHFEIPSKSTRTYKNGAINIRIDFFHNSPTITSPNISFRFEVSISSATAGQAVDLAVPTSGAGFNTGTYAIPTNTDYSLLRYVDIQIPSPSLTAGNKWIGFLKRNTDADYSTEIAYVTGITVYES